MKRVAWILSIGLMFAVACAFRAPDLLPRDMVAGMIVATILLLPAFWSPPDGLFLAIAPSGKVRIALAILLPILIALAGTPMGVDRFMILPPAAA